MGGQQTQPPDGGNRSAAGFWRGPGGWQWADGRLPRCLRVRQQRLCIENWHGIWVWEYVWGLSHFVVKAHNTT